jgi:hypothetical protein
MATSDRVPNQPQGMGMPGNTEPTSGVTERLQQTASRVADTVQDAAAPVLDKAGERAGEVAEKVMDQASSRMDIGKDYAVESLSGFAQALRQAGHHLQEEGAHPTLGHYAETGAQRLERLTGYLRERDTNQVLSEVESYARRNPTIFAGGAFALGLLTARFFRSSGQSSSSLPTTGRTATGHFAPLTPSASTMTDTGAATRSPMGQPSGGLSAAPAARTIPATPDWNPSATGDTSPSPRTGTQAPQTDPLTSTPGSSPSGASTPPRGSGTAVPTVSPASRPGNPSSPPESGAGDTPRSTERPQSDRPKI